MRSRRRVSHHEGALLHPHAELLLVGRLALAVVLAGLIGVERELRQKNAGLWTRAYSPRHSGLRLARKASIPSLKSADM